MQARASKKQVTTNNCKHMQAIASKYVFAAYQVNLVPIVERAGRCYYVFRFSFLRGRFFFTLAFLFFYLVVLLLYGQCSPGAASSSQE